MRYTVNVSIVVEAEDEAEADIAVQATLENVLTTEGNPIQSFTIFEVDEEYNPMDDFNYVGNKNHY